MATIISMEAVRSFSQIPPKVKQEISSTIKRRELEVTKNSGQVVKCKVYYWTQEGEYRFQVRGMDRAIIADQEVKGIVRKYLEDLIFCQGNGG